MDEDDLARDLQEMVYVVSHDLRGPVRRADGFLSLLDMKAGLEGEEKHWLERARASMDRLQAMLDGLLSWSRVMTHGGDFEDVDLGGLLKAALARVEGWEEAGGGLRTEGEAAVHADPRQVEELLRLLLENALVHREGRPLAVRVAARREGDRVHVEVADEGPGFDPALAQRVTKPFHVLQPEQQHLGMGLALAKRIVERHGGAFEVVPEPDKGVRVRFDLPAAL